MQGVWTAQQIREAEEVLLARMPDGVLMRRAAHGLALGVRRFLGERRGRSTGRRVTLLVGAGNNGGDALWAGAGLRRGGLAVTAVLLAPDRAHPEGLAALRRAHGRVLGAEDPAAREAVAGADVVVDGIVGISGKGALREPAGALVEAAGAAGVPIVAVDLPSGVDADTGTTEGAAVRATLTVTFGALKPVHVLARPRCGEVVLVDIGLGPHLPEPHAWVLDTADAGERWPIPGPTDDKYTQGVVGVAAGSATYPGAAVLATGSAVLATSGMVRFAGTAADVVRSHWPEVVGTDDLEQAGRTQAWSVGPGIGTDDAGYDLLAGVLARDVPTCIDADGITLLAEHEDLRRTVRGRSIVLTPHAGEFARMAGDVGADRIGAARRAAAELDVTVLLKGNATVVADPDGRALVNPSDNAWAATAGSGDVLTGMVGALLAAGLEPWWAAGCAAHVHSRAATLAAERVGGEPAVPAPASTLQAAIPAAIHEVRKAALGE
ncbi:NAD(P)H-hydrate dehydratase [Pseudonocardia sp. RS11V-5]|uniref:NAD(P)H-hydrate dehydratase n=1 Tax=Pseudonocardia terrae TaxID=2905831 RepID=UPI001E30732F|nr:NAD(P)H-hydrate dehydratase [Pseudonocardia terrae]MCE3554245.1 NAD(P)H-hydrate dehydratase [Pseudonocardia terrae]